MNRLIKELFNNRGYDENFIESIEKVTNQSLKDIDKFADKLSSYSKEDLLVVLPDFDMDGIMSALVGFVGLSELGFNVRLYEPSTNARYGFDQKDIDKIIERFGMPKAIITCDVGTSCFEGVAYAKSLGVDMLVTDHHKQQRPGLHADVLVNPMRLDEDYPSPGICGANVLFKCLMYYTSCRRDDLYTERLSRLAVFSGIGTVSDSMPVLYENRKLIRDSVAICRLIFNNGDPSVVNNMEGCKLYQDAFKGLYQMLYKFYEKGKIKDGKDIDEDFFGFYLAPMFNSIRRLGESVDYAYNLFFGEFDENFTALDNMNEKRKDMVKLHYEDLLTGYQPYAPLIYISDAMSSVLGLLANKLMSESGLPTFVLRRSDDGSYTGSGRSPIWYMANTRLNQNGFRAAGHEQAFGGVYLANADRLHELYDFLNVDVFKTYEELLSQGDLASAYDIDLVACDYGFELEGELLGFDAISGYLREIRKYKPFGNGFSKPIIKLNFSEESGNIMFIGNEKQHTKIKLDSGLDILCWNQRFDPSKGKAFVVGDFSYSEFRDVVSIIFMGDINYARNE